MRHLRVSILLAAGVFSAASLAALPPTNSTASYESALEFFEAGNSNVAVRQLKALLSANPDDLASRVLLGETYLSLGFAAAAESQLRTALRSGANRDRVVVALAQAMFMQRKFEALLAELHAVGHPPQVQAELLVIRGLARLKLREPDAAEKAFAEAQRLTPLGTGPLVGRAQLKVYKGDLEGARRDAVQATELEPKDPQAWYVRGIIAVYLGNPGAAHEYFSKAVALSPYNMPARTARATLDVQAGRFDAAREDVEYIRDKTVDDPHAEFLYSRILRHAGDVDGAASALATAASILKALPSELIRNDAQTLLLSGHVSLAQENLEEAYRLFSMYVNRFPSHLGVRVILGRLYAQRKQFPEALAVMAPVFSRESSNPKLAEFHASLLLGVGRIAEATPILARLQAAQPDDIGLTLKYARALLQQGEFDQGAELLRAALAIEPDNRLALMALGTTSLHRGQPEEALSMAQAFLEAEPASVNALNLKGSALMALRDIDGARRAYQEGLVAIPGHLASSRNLANAHLLSGDAQAAIRTLEEALAVHPDSVSTMLELARVLEGAGQVERARERLEKARSTAGRNLEPAALLVRFLLRQGLLEDARRVVRELEANDREEFFVLEVRALVERASGQRFKARTTYDTMSRLTGFDAVRLRYIAERQSAIGDTDGARWSLQKALKGDAKDARVLVALIELETRLARTSEARDYLESLMALGPRPVLVYSLEGDILSAEARFAEAAATYGKALEVAKTPSSRLVVRQFSALVRAGQEDAAKTLADDWLKTRPGDSLVRMRRGNWHASRGRRALAQADFEAIIEREPRNVLALNQLAFSLAETDLERAYGFAAQAYDLAPESAPVLDTFGWILTLRKDYERALKLLRDAQARAGDRPEISYHIAVALDGAGRRPAALKLLLEAVGSGTSFVGKEEAKALIARWQQ